MCTQFKPYFYNLVPLLFTCSLFIKKDEQESEQLKALVLLNSFTLFICSSFIYINIDIEKYIKYIDTIKQIVRQFTIVITNPKKYSIYRLK